MPALRHAREPDLNSGILPGNVRADDWIMLSLAVLSAGLLGYLFLESPSWHVGLVIFAVDCVVCAVFLAEFLWRWRKRGWRRDFLARNWYELIAMLPAAHPVLIPHRFISAVLLLVRLGRAADRAVGEQFTYRLVDRLTDPIVLAVRKPVTIAVLDEVVKVLQTGHYADNLARSIGEHREELRAIIVEKIAEDPQLRRLRRLPFHGEIVGGVVDVSFRVLLEVLSDPRMDTFVAAVVRDNREQIRHAVQEGLNEAG